MNTYYSRPGSNGRNGYDTPNLSIVQKKPDLPEMRAELKRSTDDYWEFYDRNEHCLNARYCFWEGQTRDGRKWGTPTRPPFPWPGASDARIRHIDLVINEQVEMLMLALQKMNIQCIPQQAKDAEWANRMSSLLRWYLVNQMGDEADSEFELLLNYMLTYGCAVLSVGWKQELSYEQATVTLQELTQAAQEAGGPQLMAEVGMMIFDQTMEEQVLAWILSFSNMLTKRTAKKVLKDLRQLGVATFPRPFVRESRPCIGALQVGQDVFFPGNTRRLAHARWIAQRELLTEADLRERVEGRAQWDEEFVDEVIANHKSETFNQNIAALNLLERQRSLGGAWGEEWNEAEELYEVWHFYARQSEGRIPAIMHTVFHPGCDEYFGIHEILDYKHGLYPFIEFTRERQVPTIIASRGWPECLDTEQDAIKSEYDARRDRAAITTLPPIKEKIRVGEKTRAFGPGIVAPVKNMDDLDVMAWGAPDPTSIEIEKNTRRNVAEYVGRAHAELDPQTTVNRQQALVSRVLKRIRLGCEQILANAQQFTPQMTIARVSGLIPKEVEIDRETIAGKFELFLTFDARFANQEFVFGLLERLEKYVLPLDTQAIVDRNALIRYSLWMVDPTLADLVVRDPQDASQTEIDDEQVQFAKMYAGQEVPMKVKGQNHALRLQIMQSTLQSNPMMPKMLHERPDFRKLVENRMEFLEQQVAQNKNKTIGIYGTTPTKGSPGASGSLFAEEAA